MQKSKELYRNLSYQVDHDFTFLASSSLSLLSQRGHLLDHRICVPVGWKDYARCRKSPRRTSASERKETFSDFGVGVGAGSALL